MNIIDLANLVKWKKVKRAIKYFYPTDKNDYEALFYEIQKYPKLTLKDKNERIVLHSTFNSIMESDKELADNIFYSIATNKYSLSFRFWKEVANIPIEKETLQRYVLEDILAHFIWEITYYGTENQMQKKSKSLMKSVKEINTTLKKEGKI
jgi:hypothetical protein